MDVQYETFIGSELIDFIDQKFKTVKSKQGRFITGVSMGGHGAIYLAIKHQDKFLVAGSISGAFDLRKLKYDHLTKNFEELLGKGEGYEDRLRNISIISLTSNLKAAKLQLIIDCGLNDVLYEDNKSFHETLVKEKIDHDYTERPGEHNWNYFSNSLEYHLLFFLKETMKK